MNLAIIFAVGAFAGVVWNIVSTMVIVSRLKEKGHKINFVLLKALAPVYAHRYKNITLEETGKVAPLYYHWLISINVALVMGILAIVFLER